MSKMIAAAALVLLMTVSATILSWPTLRDYFDPVNIVEIATVDVPAYESYAAKTVLYHYWSREQEPDRIGKIAYADGFTTAFLDTEMPGSTAGKVQIFSLVDSAYDRDVRSPTGGTDITLPHLLHLLKADMATAAPQSGIMHVSLASFMADADRQTTDHGRPLMHGNDFGTVYSYIRDKDGVRRLIRADWMFSEGGWVISLTDRISNGSSRGVRYLFPA